MKALADSLEREAPEPTPERQAVEAVLRQWFWDDWARLTKTERETKFGGATADLLALPDPVRDAAREVVEASKRAPSFMPPGLLLAMSRLRAALDESEHA